MCAAQAASVGRISSPVWMCATPLPRDLSTYRAAWDCLGMVELPGVEPGSQCETPFACEFLDLQAAINRFLDEHNEKPKPFVWRADPLRVLAAIERGKQALESIH